MNFWPLIIGFASAAITAAALYLPDPFRASKPSPAYHSQDVDYSKLWRL